MVPTDYRLDHVAARLVERLEGARRSYADDERARTAFGEIAREHVEAAIVELEAVGMMRDASDHADFLRTEIERTVLPRYHRLATEMSAREAGGFGMGRLAQPLGRLGLVVVALLLLWFVLLRMAAVPVVWPLFLIDLSLPFWPDIAAAFTRRSYRTKLEAMIEDLTRIQDGAQAYLSASELTVEDEPAPRRPAPREPERNS